MPTITSHQIIGGPPMASATAKRVYVATTGER